MRIVITGSEGYLGTVLAKAARDAGYEVVGLDKVQSYRDDITLSYNIESIQPGDTVIHLAAIVGDAACARDIPYSYHTNVTGTRNVAETCKRKGAAHLIFASSCSVYGATNGEKVSEDSPLEPVSAYAKQKIEAEELLREYVSDFPVTIMRLSTLMGVSYRMRYDLAINMFARDIERKGEITIQGGGHWRPFLHVRDAARAFLLAAENPDKPGIYNVGGEHNCYQMDAVARLLEQFGNVEVSYAAKDLRSYNVDFSKVRRALDFKPEISIESAFMEVQSHVRTCLALEYCGLIPDPYDARWRN